MDKSVLPGPRDLNNNVTAFIIYFTSKFSGVVIISLKIYRVQRIKCHCWSKSPSMPNFLYTWINVLISHINKNKSGKVFGKMGKVSACLCGFQLVLALPHSCLILAINSIHPDTWISWKNHFIKFISNTSLLFLWHMLIKMYHTFMLFWSTLHKKITIMTTQAKCF